MRGGRAVCLMLVGCSKADEPSPKLGLASPIPPLASTVSRVGPRSAWSNIEDPALRALAIAKDALVRAGLPAADVAGCVDAAAAFNASDPAPGPCRASVLTGMRSARLEPELTYVVVSPPTREGGPIFVEGWIDPRASIAVETRIIATSWAVSADHAVFVRGYHEPMFAPLDGGRPSVDRVTLAAYNQRDRPIFIKLRGASLGPRGGEASALESVTLDDEDGRGHEDAVLPGKQLRLSVVFARRELPIERAKSFVVEVALEVDGAVLRPRVEVTVQ